LTVGVSVLLLAWVLLLLEGPSCVQSSSPHSPAPTASIGNVSSLTTVQTFTKGKSEIPDEKHSEILERTNTLDDELRARAKPGDMVLVLGSADCIPDKDGNTTLATDRASAVAKRLKGVVPGVEVQTLPLRQHDSCKETGELRAAYPFLIHINQSSQ
jgi:hypothetical protein